MGVVMKPKKGMTLVEVMLATLVLAIVTLGSAFLYIYGIGHIGVSKHRRAAAQLAAQKLEQLRANNSFNIPMPLGETSEDIPLEGMSYTRSTETIETEDSGLGSCKKVVVTVDWTQNDKHHNVSMASLYVNRGVQ